MRTRTHAAAVAAILAFSAAPAVAAPASSPGEPGAAGEPDPLAGTSYRRRLDDLSRRLDVLRDQVHGGQRHLHGLEYTVMHHLPGGARARIVHRNRMSSSYTPVRLSYVLDGTPIAVKADPHGVLAPGAALPMFDQPLAPTAHTLSVTIEYRLGGPARSLFPYLGAYTYTLQGSSTFTVDDHLPTEVEVEALERGNPLTTDFRDRPALGVHVRIPGAR